MNFVRSVLRGGRRPLNDYELLPRDDLGLPSSRNDTSPPTPTRFRPRRWTQLVTIRRVLLCLGLIPILLICGILWSGIPPSYSHYWQYERDLPQHNLSLSPPEGQNGSYIRFSNALWGHGWNNVLQELIMHSHLASSSNRSFVFEPYVWSHTPFPYTLYDFALRPARIPLNAIISGPGAGGGHHAPRAVNVEWWETVCPPERRLTLDSSEVSKGLGNAEGSELFERWVDTLTNTEPGCVEIAPDSPSIFDWNLFGSPRILSLWDRLSASPILTSFAWSPVVVTTLLSNLPLLTSNQSSTLPENLPGLVAVHIRRGDYVRHCQRLFGWSASFQGFSTFPSLPNSSHFEPPPVSSPTERLAYYTQRCWPSYDDIAHRVEKVRQEWETAQSGQKLDRIFVLTNGGRWWSHWLKERLAKDGWAKNKIKVSSDLSLGREARHVDFAVDMAIAERATVFIGNGFSSLTSNVILLRMARAADPKSNHLW
ncbi:hypothetical protein K439DRAFT_1397933 [Ramaria rubella]|nr:hypothetical protein K439DRAFT_1397933 [Ramaria rubella]